VANSSLVHDVWILTGMGLQTEDGCCEFIVLSYVWSCLTSERSISKDLLSEIESGNCAFELKMCA
jgi:hypothetical protein